MTMSVVDDIMTSNLQNKENAEIISEPSAVAIGTEFARQYYNLLAEKPKTVHKFYSHESTLQIGDTTVVGQEKIGREIEGLVGNEKCRIKICSIKGNMTLNQGIALQVFGEISGRRFVQTFILGPQGLKKYYVQHDFFQFIDQVFATSKESPSPASTPTPVSVEKTVAASSVNGHKQAVESPKAEASVAPVPVVAALEPAPAPVEKPKPVVVEPATPAAPVEERPAKRQPTPRKEESKKKEEPAKAEAAPAPAPVVDNTPKTWANLVGGGGKANVTTVTPSGQPAPQQAKPQPKPAPAKAPAATKPPQTNGAPPASAASNDRKLHVGGIAMTIVPESTTVAENELKEALSKYGEVESVSIPRKVLENPVENSRPAFGFITMKSASDVQTILKTATKGERGAMLPNIKIPSFGFDGEIVVSEQKEPRFGGHRGGRGHFRGGRGGRGAPFRGGFSNNSTNQQ